MVFSISGDVLVSLIMIPHFGIGWIFSCGRLVCSDWNKAILSSPLSVRISLGVSCNKDRIYQFMRSGVDGLFRGLHRVSISGLDIDAMHLALLPKSVVSGHSKSTLNYSLSHLWNYGMGVIKSFTKLSYEDVHLLSLFDGISGFEINGVSDEGVLYLMKHEKFFHLEEICLSSERTRVVNRITKVGISHLVMSQFNNLKTLDLRGGMLGVEGFKHLSQQLSFPHLTTLILKGSHNFEHRLDEGCKYLSNGNFSRVTFLDLSDCKIGDDGVEYLFKGMFNDLKRINLNYNYIGEKACKSIADSTLASVEHLELASQCIRMDKDSCKQLSRMSFRLKHLDLQGNDIQEGFSFLCQCNSMENLEYLNLKNSCLKFTACKHIAESVFKSSLTFLDLSNNGLKLESLFGGTLIKLKTLNISGSNYLIRDIPILKSESLPSIQSIDLSHHTVSTKFIEWMTESFKCLEYLNLKSTSITDADVLLLKKVQIKNIDLSENNLELFENTKWGHFKTRKTFASDSNLYQ